MTKYANDLEAAIAWFESNWKVQQPPTIAEVPCSGDEETRDCLTCELVLIDMELRWQATHQGAPPNDHLGGQPRWGDYFELLPQRVALGEVPTPLIAEEYRIRQLWGDRPTHDQFISAFADHLTRLPPLLAEIDQQLLADNAVEPTRSPAEPTYQGLPDPRAPLPWSDYLLHEHLGSGGFGKVYRATQKSLSRTVAVKSLRKKRLRDPVAIERFIQEARLLARLKHPNIVGVQGLGRFPGGGYFLVLDYVEGVDLQQRIENGNLPPIEAATVTRVLASAIDFAHSQDVIHADLKPSNILFNPQSEPTITDFGLGFLLPHNAPLSSNQGLPVGGTRAYLAPEVLEGAPPDRGMDVYGLGACLHAMLTGSPPTSDRKTSTIPHELVEILNRCLTPDRSMRFGSAAELENALFGWLNSRET